MSEKTSSELKTETQADAEASRGTRAARAKALWGFGFVLFTIALAGLWWMMKLKYDANTTPESYSYVSKFEKDGIGRWHR